MKSWAVAIAINKNPLILDQVKMDYEWKFSLTICLLQIILVQAISQKRLSSEQVNGEMAPPDKRFGYGQNVIWWKSFMS